MLPSRDARIAPAETAAVITSCSPISLDSFHLPYAAAGFPAAAFFREDATVFLVIPGAQTSTITAILCYFSTITEHNSNACSAIIFV